jgi:hypothetical protein
MITLLRRKRLFEKDKQGNNKIEFFHNELLCT